MAIPPIALPTFWATQRFSPARDVVEPTTGDAQPIPYHFLPGSAGGSDPSEVETGQEAAFPTLGPSNTLAPKPDGFDLAPALLDPAKFAGWHSAHQDEYVRKNASAPGAVVAIGPTPPSGQPDQRIYVLASETKQPQIYVLSTLQKRDFAKMSLADQTAIASTTYFLETLAPRFGLTPTGSATVAQAKAAAIALVDKLVDKIVDDPRFTFFQDSSSPPGWERKTANPAAIRQMAAEHAELFLKQLDNLKARIGTSAIFSPADIEATVAGLETRWNRARAFADVTSGDSYFGLGRGLIGLDTADHLSDVKRGYKAFIDQERRLLQLDNARLDIARTGQTSQKTLDVPNLVFLLQLNYNLTVEAKVTADAEEVNQFNTLLKMYSAMQDLVNRTTAEFDSSKNDEKKGLLGKNNDSTAGSLSDKDLRVAAIFEDALGNQDHPLEVMYKIDRPKEDMFYNGPKDKLDNRLNESLRTKWESFGTRLADKVTLINQESQIRTNDINSLDKQKNRHFDLANGALSKMSDMIQSIGRNIS